ncbi:ubiquinol-cytochrome c reductase iron-sulfur subunit [Prauserella muralis]|uniref:Cytochrome bc1 complex Rieske iron-sulfur subunit n=1 Tax=Prauserella muralis TaxID=588067 RepID=A0A2V4APD4_9PSEU|nr:Rieske 2Fe-2S domain-containing protein [Prauserella muralis]PXY22209.1 (2Fe-2S)-binding protein [Prauserella muralis]TWE27839.1 ubiquinol-cytochrome c reductase iron-sulfur subunit [Prauserella muralis]
MEGDGRSRDELVRRSAELDGVQLEEYRGSGRPEATASRGSRLLVLTCWIGGGLSALAAGGMFLFWPWHYVPPGEENHYLYTLYTPLLGLFLGLAVLGVAAALILTVKRLLPQEVAVQQRHLENGSSEEDRSVFVATVDDARDNAGLNRRSVFSRAALASGGILGTTLGVVGLGAFVRDPWETGPHAEPKDTLWHTGWRPQVGEKVYLRLATEPTKVELVTPADLEPGASLVVFPFREAEADDPEKLAKVMEQSDNPATLYRLPEDTDVAEWPERAGMNYGDYYAFSRVCTHLGCPVGMYETALDRAMCPCHQSQFNLADYAKPIFGPATRPLPQLPIDVDSDGYFIALGDFTGPVGPAFWLLGKQP